MLRISRKQFEGFTTAAQGRLKSKTTALVIQEHPTFADDQDAIGVMVAQLIKAGFESEDLLFQATDSLLRIAQMQGPDAAQKRALADRILFEDTHPPAARLAFLQAQHLIPNEDET